MFDADGDFGKVRLNVNLPVSHTKTLFCMTSVGWHLCNSKYVQDRINGSPFITILVAVSGKGKLSLSSGEYKLNAGDVVVLPPNMPHKYAIPKNSLWEFYWLHLFNNYASRYIDKITEDSGYVFHYGDVRPLCDILEILIRTSNKNDPACPINCSFAVSDLLHNLLLFGAKKPEQAKSSDIILEHAVAYFEAKYDQQLSLDELSQSLFISTTHLIRIFKSQLQTTPYQYLKNYRITHACTLLVHTTMSVSDIARNVGYLSLSNFIKRFKKVKGTTPTQYRKFNIII